MPMSLKDLVAKYLALAGGYGRPVALAAFGLERREAERLFGLYDEDYHISRYFHFSRGEGEAYGINGFEQTHLSIYAEIATVL
jgi:hypothetical protein